MEAVKKVMQCKRDLANPVLRASKWVELMTS